MEQLSFYKTYVRPEIKFGDINLPMKSTYKKSPSLGTVCRVLCSFRNHCPRFFSDKCYKADLRTNFITIHYF